MLVTEVTITVKAGDGGDGKVSFYKNQKGPDGGNGANGADVYIVATTDMYALSDLMKTPVIEAQDGPGGMSGKKSGKVPQDTEIRLPVGSIVTDTKTNQIFSVDSDHYRALLCRGGKGGRGNFEMRSATNITPKAAEKGFPAQAREVYINLKLIADVGLIGFPNAGKSSLLKEITNAHPKIGAYPFTTLEPNLGALEGRIIADIPGLIEGASTGKGLGMKFLKHIERVSLIFHCISCENDDVEQTYLQIREELGSYNARLLDIQETILLTKTDTVGEKQVKDHIRRLKKHNPSILPVSIHDTESIQKLTTLIRQG